MTDRDHDYARNYAIGWILSVLRAKHPELLIHEADRAEKTNPDAAEVIREWARCGQ